MRRLLSQWWSFFALVSIAAMAPAAASAGWVSTGGPVGGLGYDVRIHPIDPDTMFVTDNYGGVIKSTNAGELWQAKNQGILRTGPTLEYTPIFCLTIDPNDPNIVWAGTFADGRDFGAFKSTDGGETWTAMNNGLSDGGYGLVFRGFTIQPGNSDVVYAQTEMPTGLMGLEFSKVKGRMFRTTNGGASWNLIWEGDNLARYLIIDPTNPNTLYLSTGIFDREAANSDCNNGVAGGVGVLKSTDGGQNWSPVNQGLIDLYVGSLRMHPKNPQILFAATGNNACTKHVDGLGFESGLFRTTNGGATWTKVIAGEIITTVNFSPSNPDIMYAGCRSAFFRSADGGSTWIPYGKPGSIWGPPGIQAGVPIDVTVDPDDPDVVFVNNYGGGVFRSTDGAKSWEYRSRGYTGADIHLAAVADASGSSLYAIGPFGPFKSDNYGVDWIGIGNGQAILFPAWYGMAVSPENPKTILIADDGWGCILRSTDGGRSFTQVFQRPDTDARIYDKRGGFKALAFAGSNPSVVYAGFAMTRNSITTKTPSGSVVFKSLNGGATFSGLSPGMSNVNVFRLVVDPNHEDIAWAATTGGIYKTVDGGSNWSLIESLGKRVIMSLALDPKNPNTMLAGEMEVGIWKSTDGGATWPGGPYNTGITNPVPSITNFIFDPVGSSRIFASDLYNGLYSSEDGGNSWAGYPDSEMTGLAIKVVKDIAYANGVMYAATQGGGVFRVGGPSVIPSPASANFGSITVGLSSTARQITVYNTGTAIRTIAGISVTGADAADFSIIDDRCTESLTESMSCIFNIVFSPKEAGLRTASVNIESDDSVVASYSLSLSGSGIEANSGGGGGGGASGGGGGGGGCFITTIAP